MGAKDLQRRIARRLSGALEVFPGGRGRPDLWPRTTKGRTRHAQVGQREAKMACQGHPSGANMHLTMIKVQNVKMYKNYSEWFGSQHRIAQFCNFSIIIPAFGQLFRQIGPMLSNSVLFWLFFNILNSFELFLPIWFVQGGPKVQAPKALGGSFGQNGLAEH